MENNCEVCGLHKFCEKPRIRAWGNIDHPRLIIIGGSPNSTEDKEGTILPNQFLLDSLEGSKDQVYITYSVKCCAYQDHFVHEHGIRRPSKQEIDWCNLLLFQELSLFDSSETVIMTLGDTSLTSLVSKHKGIEKELGKVQFVKINEKVWKVFPNYRPSDIVRNRLGTTAEKEFHRIIKQALTHDQIELEEDRDWMIAEPSVAIKEANLITEAYQDDAIKYVVYDCETSGLLPWKDKIIMYSFFANKKVNKRAVAVPLQVSNIIHHENYPYRDKVYPINFDVSVKDKVKINQAIGKMIETVPLVGHLLKFDISFAAAAGIAKLEKIRIHYDTLLLAHILIGRQMFGYLDLKTLCVKMFGIENWELPIDAYRSLFRKIEDRTFDKIPTSILGEYAAKDSFYNDVLYRTLKGQLDNTDQTAVPGQDDKKIIKLLHNILPVFTEAETKGIWFDTQNFNYIQEAYNKMAKNEYDKMASLIEDWIAPRRKGARAENAKKKKPLPIEELEKKIFNPGSSQQKADILFKFFKMESTKTGASGVPSCDKEVIEALIRHKDTIEDQKQFLISLSSYTSLKKLISSYLENADDMLDNNIYHPSYQINGTITGRHSSGFHTLPKKSDIKRLFISRWAEEGGIFGCFDFSQLELRIVASLADEEKWIQAFENGVDIHTATAAVVFGVRLEKVTSDQRKQAKTVNFGLIYGLSDKSLGEQLNIKTIKAKKIKEGLFSGCSDLGNWFQECYNEVNTTHQIVTIFGRVIPINMKNFKGEDDVEANQRRSVNYKVQSPASDLVTDSIGRISKAMKKKEMKSLIVGSVHDSILFDIYPGELNILIKMVKYICEVENKELYPWIKCPIVIDTTLGTSWGGCLDFDVKYTEEGILLTCKEGLRKDFNMLFDAAEKAYKWDYKVISEEEIVEQPKDKVIKDRYNWNVEILI